MLESPHIMDICQMTSYLSNVTCAGFIAVSYVKINDHDYKLVALVVMRINWKIVYIVIRECYFSQI